jgi:hypothetical protein
MGGVEVMATVAEAVGSHQLTNEIEMSPIAPPPTGLDLELQENYSLNSPYVNSANRS